MGGQPLAKQHSRTPNAAATLSIFDMCTHQWWMSDRTRFCWGWPPYRVLHCELPTALASPAPGLPGCREEIVHVLQSTTPEDMERNVEQLAAWCRSWRPAS